MVVVAILALAIVALPGLGPGPGSSAPRGTGQPPGTAAATAPGVAIAATDAPTDTDADATDTPEPTDTGLVAVATTAPTTDTPGPTVPGQAYPRPATALRKRLDRAFKQMAEETGSPGLVAAVKLPDGSVWYGSDGVLWPGGPDATPDTPFAWGSITKTFVATLTLRAATAGQLSLDQTIDTWLPQIPNANLITVRMLLAHRSGLFDYFQSKEYAKRVFSDPSHVWTPDEILAMIGPSVYPPGTGFNYSNTNYVLLGMILEQITGQPLATIIHDQLLAPLGLDETVFQQAGQPVDLVGAKGFWKSG